MNFQLQLTQALECKVCKQFITHERQHETAQLKIVFGSSEFAVCPCCQQSVEDHKNRDYRLRAEKFIDRRLKIHDETTEKKVRSRTRSQST